MSATRPSRSASSRTARDVVTHRMAANWRPRTRRATSRTSPRDACGQPITTRSIGSCEPFSAPMAGASVSTSRSWTPSVNRSFRSLASGVTPATWNRATAPVEASAAPRALSEFAATLSASSPANGGRSSPSKYGTPLPTWRPTHQPSAAYSQGCCGVQRTCTRCVARRASSRCSP